MKGWTFRRKMILAYATISFLVSVSLGYVVYATSASYERERSKNALAVSGRSYVTQMEDRLSRMDAIISYLLSEPTLLENITLLSHQVQGINIPPRYIREAREGIRIGISTDYIMENSYRTVFANEDFFASSALKLFGNPEEGTRRLRENFSLEELSYLSRVREGAGKSVFIGAHEDYWGAAPRAMVFSLMKEIRGTGMGFIEVENRLDSLESLQGADPELGYVLYTGNEVLYEGGKDLPPGLLEEGDLHRSDWTQGGYLFSRASSERFDLSVVAYRPVLPQARVFATSFITSMAAFGLSLAVIILWSHLLTRPINQLRGVMEATNMENLAETGHLAMEDAGMDEFAALGAAYEAMIRRVNKAVENERRYEKLQIQAQFDVLQTQVNPHFIYNVLNIISSRGVMADDEVICEMCGSLGSMLRYSTNNKERFAKVQEEVEYLHNYFYLLECRYESRLKVDISLQDEVKEKIIPKMTLQQVVENSVKHGFHDTDVDMEISLTGEADEEGWRIYVRDNGSGVEEEQLRRIQERLEGIHQSFLRGSVPTEAQIGGMGLANVYARCLLLFNQALVFDIQNRPEGSGTQVCIGVREMDHGEDAGKVHG